jgi:putative membrane protein
MKMLSGTYKWMIVLFAFAIALLACNAGGGTTDAKRAAMAQNKEGWSGRELDAANFMVYAADQGLDQIQKAQLAEGRTEHEVLKEQSRKVVQVQHQLMAQLNRIAGPKEVSLPETPSKKHVRECERLADRYRSDFDTVYTRWLTDELSEEIQRFEKESSSNVWSVLRDFAFESLPPLQELLENVKMFRSGQLTDAPLLQNIKQSNNQSDEKKRPKIEK